MSFVTRFKKFVMLVLCLMMAMTSTVAYAAKHYCRVDDITYIIDTAGLTAELVSVPAGTKNLVIPRSISYDGDTYRLNEIDLSGNDAENIENILFEVDSAAHLPNGNLPANSQLYFRFELSRGNLNILEGKFGLDLRGTGDYKGPDVSRLHAASEAEINATEVHIHSTEYSEQGVLQINFAEVLGAHNYRVIMMQNGDEIEVSSNDAGQEINFGIMNGKVSFTYGDLQPGLTYSCVVYAESPFGQRISSQPFNISTVVNNAEPDPPADDVADSSSVPSTGDDTPILMLMLLMVACAGWCVLSTLRIKKQKI